MGLDDNSLTDQEVKLKLYTPFLSPKQLFKIPR
jgi:hypothetical protein